MGGVANVKGSVVAPDSRHLIANVNCLTWKDPEGDLRRRAIGMHTYVNWRRGLAVEGESTQTPTNQTVDNQIHHDVAGCVPSFVDISR